MGKRKKRRKRRRAEERAEQARQDHLAELAAEDSDYDDDDDEEDEEDESLGSRFGFGRFRQSKQEDDDAPQYEDKPWWSQEEDYELTDYERKQYGDYEKMPPPLKPEHLREPEEKKPEEAAPSPITQVAAVTTQEVGKVVERVKKIDWELVQVRASEIMDSAKSGGKRVVDEVQFRNLQMREKVPSKFHIPIYIAIAVVLIGIPLSIIVLLFAGRGGNPDNEIAAQITTAPQNNTISVQPTQTPVPEVIVPTLAPATAQPTFAPLPTNTPIPPTPIPPTDVPIVQPTTAPVIAESAGIAPFFIRGVQTWSADIGRWSQLYGIDANYLAIVMQLDTCGNPQFVGADGRMGLFAVPLDRFQEGEAFVDPEVNVRRAAELITQCQALTGNDPGQTYTCYRSNTDTTQTDFGSWTPLMQQYFLWTLGMVGDVQTNVVESAALNNFLVTGGGIDLCNQAHAVLDNR